MKKFTILMGLFLATVITGSAFAQPVTFTPEQIKKIEDHIVGLNTQIEELTAENKALKAEIAEANQKINAPSGNAEGVVTDLIGTDSSNIVEELKKKIADLEKRTATQSDTIKRLMDRNIELSKTGKLDLGEITDNRFEIDSFYTKFNYAYVELDVKQALNKITCRVKNSAGITIDSDTTFSPAKGWHKQSMILPSKNMKGLTVSCKAQ